MKDRLPKYPGRVTLTPVPGQANTYDMKRADEPIVTGTPLNKGTLASDKVITDFGLTPETATPNDLFAATLAYINSAPRIESYSYIGTGGDGVNHPCSVEFSFAPDVVIHISQEIDSEYAGYKLEASPQTGGATYSDELDRECYVVHTNLLTGSYKKGYGFHEPDAANECYAKKSKDGKRITWYCKKRSEAGGSPIKSATQLNNSGDVYYFIGIKFGGK